MSSLLDQAIVDAAALKDAAMKNAENLVLEKYSGEVKDAINSLLEQDEAPMMGAPADAAPAVDSSFVDEVPLAHENREIIGPEEDEVIEIDFDDIRSKLHAEEEAGELEASEMVDSEQAAEEIFGDTAAPAEEIPVPEAPEAAEEEEELTISEDLLKTVVEELTVDINPKADIATGFAPMASGDTQAHSEEVEAEIEAKEKESEEVTAEKEKYVELYENKVDGLDEEINELKTLLNEAKEHLNYLILENAKLVYQNKALNNYSLNERQKEKIVEAVLNAKSAEEAKSLYDTLQSAVGGRRDRQLNSLSEAVSRPTTSMLHSAKRSESTSTTDPHMMRMLRLAGIKN
jgi:regulator of replication initiation timing